MKVHVKLEAELPTDSLNYEVLTEAVERTSEVSGATCEIGLRRGGGSKFIIDALARLKGSAAGSQNRRSHVAVDPYGNIPYLQTDAHPVRLDYTNGMRNECLMNMYLYAAEKNVDFYFMNMTDAQFFRRFSDGIPM